MCSSFATLVSNLISLSSQFFLIAALETSLSPSNPLINPTSSLNSCNVLTDTAALFSCFLLIHLPRPYGLELIIILVSMFLIFSTKKYQFEKYGGGAVILYSCFIFTLVFIWFTSWFFKYSCISLTFISGFLSLIFYYKCCFVFYS